MISKLGSEIMEVNYKICIYMAKLKFSYLFITGCTKLSDEERAIKISLRWVGSQ